MQNPRSLGMETGILHGFGVEMGILHVFCVEYHGPTPGWNFLLSTWFHVKSTCGPTLDYCEFNAMRIDCMRHDKNLPFLDRTIYPLTNHGYNLK